MLESQSSLRAPESAPTLLLPGAALAPGRRGASAGGGEDHDADGERRRMGAGAAAGTRLPAANRGGV